MKILKECENTYAENNRMCYFRTQARNGRKKVLIQITERCNLRCVHCFVNSETNGNEMSKEFLIEHVLPYLRSIDTERVTLTGGEPFCHKDIFGILDLLSSEFSSITICTNGTLIDSEVLCKLSVYKNLKLNVSLDGFSSESHDRFRGRLGAFEKTISCIHGLDKIGKMGGILVTPNNFSSIEEYKSMCDELSNIGCKFILFNPLSEYGRGEVNKSKYGISDKQLNLLRETTIKYNDKVEVIYSNFPQIYETCDTKCIRDGIRYIYVDGSVVACPYISFATDGKNNEPIEYNDNKLGKLGVDCTVDESISLRTYLSCPAFELQKRGMNY